MSAILCLVNSMKWPPLLINSKSARSIDNLIFNTKLSM